jgi:hypothetical protein
MPSTLRPRPPKRTFRNQPRAFTENLSVPVTAMPVAPSLARDIMPPAKPAAQPQASSYWLQATVVVIWLLACLAFGVGIGLFLHPRNTAVVTMPGMPVAQGTLRVAPLPAVAMPVSARPTIAPHLTVVTPSQTVTQAQAGTPALVLALTAYQASAPSHWLMPGYAPVGYPQGTVGTAAIR